MSTTMTSTDDGRRYCRCAHAQAAHAKEGKGSCFLSKCDCTKYLQSTLRSK